MNFKKEPPLNLNPKIDELWKYFNIEKHLLSLQKFEIYL